MKRARVLRPLAVLTAALVVFAACGGDDDDDDSASAGGDGGDQERERPRGAHDRILAQAPDSLYLFGALRNCSRTKSQPSS